MKHGRRIDYVYVPKLAMHICKLGRKYQDERALCIVENVHTRLTS